MAWIKDHRRPEDPRLGRVLPQPLAARQASCAARTASTAPAAAPGRSTSRTASSPGRCRRSTIRSSSRACRRTSRAAASAASRFSWYLYSPLRVKYPYMRGALLDLWREARAHARGSGRGLGVASSKIPRARRATSRRAARAASAAPTGTRSLELIAAATIYTVKKHGPDRVVGFSPIPAMSMVSYAAGARFLQLIGGVLMSFYDWYCRPAARVARGLGRADRRRRERRLVQRQVHRRRWAPT